MRQALASGAPQHLRGMVGVLRRRLWWQRVLSGALRGLSLGALVGLLLILVALWEAREPTWLQPHLAASLLALAVLAGALVRRPSLQEAARVADRRLDLEERVATSLEILEGRLASSMAARQLDDAWRAVQRQPVGRVAPLGQLRRSAALAGALLALFLASLLVSSNLDPEVSPVATLRRGLEEAVLRSGLLAQAGVQLPLLPRDEASDPFAAPPPPPLLGSQTEEQLREQMARSRSQQAALARLARALAGTAAAREIGEQLQRGNYAQAANNLRNLGRENDQLSREAKSELSEALRQAAGDTNESSPDLARQEDRAARALAGRDYRSTQQALDRLSQSMSDASQQIIPQEELAQAWQRLQEEQRRQGEGDLEGPGGASASDLQMADGAGANPSTGLANEGDSSAASSAGGPGTNLGSFNPVGKPTRLNVAGREVEIEGRPAGTGDGKGSSRAAGPTLSLKDADESGALQEGLPQPTDPVRDTAEHTSIPLGHLQAVHDYFQSGERSP
ncbi:MAG: hypothetical protein HY690_03985 [Chloroflexi bacterium]|nr:hypothetical protein [Chloroflexota bacterium]